MKKILKIFKIKIQKNSKKYFQKQITKIATKEMNVAHVIPFAP
jgi:hypothetical protein